MRINVKKFYESRLEELDIQIKQALYHQLWTKRRKLIKERNELQDKLKEIEERKKGVSR